LKIFRNPDSIHAPIAAYTHHIEISGPERLLAISGQVGKKQDGTVPSDPIDQLKIALENLKRNLTAADMDITDLVKVTFYLVGDMDPAARADVLRTFFDGYKPCMMLLFVSSLASPIYKVEIDAWASSENPLHS
jgi:2-iminobutanoate/2-iminopropanoate deaminase